MIKTSKQSSIPHHFKPSLKYPLSRLVLAVLAAFGLEQQARAQVTIDEGETVTISQSQAFSGQSFIINPGGTLTNDSLGADINGVDLKLGGTLDLQKVLFIGENGAASILSGVVSSSVDGDLVVKGDTDITAANPNLVSAVLVRDGAVLTLSATTAIGAPADAGRHEVSVETGSQVVIDASDAIDAGRGIRVEGDGILMLNADQAFANFYSEFDTQVDIADGQSLTINTTGTSEDGNRLFGDITGEGNLVFAGDGFLDIVPDMFFGGAGGQTSFTGITTVNGGGTLSLGKQGALGQSSELNVSNGSSVVINTVDILFDEVIPPDLVPSADNALNTAININLDPTANSVATLSFGANQSVNAVNTGTGSEIIVADQKTLILGSQGGTSSIGGDISGQGNLSFVGGTSSILATGTTYTGSTQISGNATLNLQTAGAFGASQSLSISDESIVNVRATNVFNDSLNLNLAADNNVIDIRGTNTVGTFTLSEGSVLVFTSNSSAANDALVLKATTGESDISGLVTASAAATLRLDGATAALNTQLPGSVTLRVQNNGHLIVNQTNAYLGTLALDSTGSQVTVNAVNGLNTTGTNEMLILPADATITFNADQTLDLLSSTAITSNLSISEGNTLSIENISPNVFLNDQKRSSYFGAFSGDGDIVLTGGILDLGGAGVASPANSLTGSFSVTGGSTLNLHKTEAISGSALRVSDGSRVIVRNGSGVFNESLDVTLGGTGDRLSIETFIQTTQIIDSLNLASGSLVEIGLANDSTPHTLQIGANSGDSVLAGDITGEGNLTITGGGITRIENPLDLSGEITVAVNNGNLTLATSGALGNPAAVDLDLSTDLTLSLNAKNAWRQETELDLPATATLEVNADQTIDQLQAAFMQVKGQGGSAPSIVLANESVLTLGTTEASLTIQGSVSGNGSLVFAGGTTALGNQVQSTPNTFTGGVTVQDGAVLELTNEEALGAVASLTVESGATVNAVPLGGNPFNNAMRVQVQAGGSLSLNSVNNTVVFSWDSLELAQTGQIEVNEGDSLYIGLNNGDSLIAGRIFGVSTPFSIRGSGTTTFESALDFSGELEITDTARVVVKAANALDVRELLPDPDSDPALNVNIGPNTTLDLEVEDAFATISQAGHDIASGARVNVNATDAIAPTGSFTFADAQSVLAFNDITQTFSGQLAGDGQVLATGATELTLSGTNNDFTGVTRLRGSSILNVNSGGALGSSQLQVLDQSRANFNSDATIASAMRVDGQLGGSGTLTFTGANARLSGTGSFSNPVVIGSGAVHAPGNSVGTQTFVDYALDIGGTLESEFEIVDNDLVFDQVVVTGDGQIGQNGSPTIEVIGLPTDWLYTSGTRYELITTQGEGELTITNLPELQTTFASPLITFRLGGDSQALWLQTLRRAYASIRTQQLGVNEFNAATGLDNVLSSGIDASDPAITGFFRTLDTYAVAALNTTASANDIDTYQRALDQVSGQRLLAQDAAYWLNVQGWNNRLTSYLQDARLAGATQPVHVAVYGGWATNQTSASRSGFDTDTYGLIVSGERAVRASQYLGFALGYENHKTSFDQYGGTSKVDSARLALSYAHEPQSRWDWRASLLGGYAWLNSTRPQPLFQTATNGTSTAWDAGFQLEAGYKVLARTNTDLRVLAGVQAIYGERQAFNETGSVTALDVASRDMTSTQSRLGLSLKHEFHAGKQSFALDARAYWLYDLSADPSNLTASYVMGASDAQSFELVDSALSKSSVWMDVGLSTDFNQQVSARLSYQGQFGNNFNAQTVSAELMMRF